MLMEEIWTKAIQQDHTIGMEPPTGLVLGLDNSLTKTGWACVNREVASHGLIKPPEKLRGAERLYWWKVTYDELLRDLTPGAVIIEAYAHNAGFQAHQIGEPGGILRVMLYERGIPWATVAPGTLKKFVTGKGDSSKQGISLHLFKRWGLVVEQEDAADATGLALMGCDIHQQTQAMEEATEKMTWGDTLTQIRTRTRA